MSGLTDEERELKRLAEVCERLTETRGLIHLGLPEVQAYLDASTPATVLRLLARIEELDARLAANDRLHGVMKFDVDALI